MSVNDLYPPAPVGVPADLAVPNVAYKRRAAAAVLGVLLFFAAYFGLIAWLVHCIVRAAGAFSSNPLKAVVIIAPAAFLAFVLVKGLFVRRRQARDLLVEVTEAEQPELVAFIHRVADETGAKRPAHIYLSPEVNAAVFLDGGLLNLLVPSRKNLILGLGLVNTLSLDELKAVVAHEFGHFAQRSMGVGQWVYLASGFVADLVGRRDLLDRGLRSLSRWDFRVAWVGWVLRALVWALRAIVDQLFRFVLLLGRALSRQMEFQADLVAVSVTGSDSLVHALHRLNAADRGFGEAARFTLSQAQRGLRVADMFAVQERFVSKHREAHALGHHGLTPPRPERGDTHRIFEHTVADAPQMWSTHPSNRDREKNCKATYLPSPLDARPAWSVMRDAARLRADFTRRFLEVALQGGPLPEPLPDTPEPLEATLERVDERFDRPALDRRYQGLFTTQRFTRCFPPGEVPARAPEPGQSDAQLVASYRALFDAALADEVEAFFQLEEEHGRLEGLRKGFLEAPGGILVHRGEPLSRKELGAVCAQVKDELEAQRAKLVDRFGRSMGLVLELARRLDARRAQARAPEGPSWEAYVGSLLALVRYGEHRAAALEDVVGNFENVLAIVFADNNVSSSELDRLVREGAEVAGRLREVFEERVQVRLPGAVRHTLTKDSLSWEALVGEELRLYAPGRQDFASDWIGAAATWWDPYMAHLGALGVVTLDVLLETHERVLAMARAEGVPEPAPEPATVPEGYRSCGFGDEIERQERLGWWDRFQTAEGWTGGMFRSLAATAILGPALWAGSAYAGLTLYVHNPFERPLLVSVGEEERRLGPLEVGEFEVDGDALALAARTEQGQVLESFVSPELAGMSDPVWNVAGAGLLGKFWAVYGAGPERDPSLLSERLFDADADYMFEDPPSSLRRRGRGPTYKSTVEALTDPDQVLFAVRPLEGQEAARRHVELDPPDSRRFHHWLFLLPREEAGARAREAYDATPTPGLLELFASRADGKAFRDFCAALPESPRSEAERYAGFRCEPTDPAFEAYAAASNDPWVRLLRGEARARQHRYEEALEDLRGLTGLAGHATAAISFRRARLLRLLGRADEVALLPDDGPYLSYLRRAEDRDPGVREAVAATWAREDGDFGPEALARTQADADADDLAFGAASVGAPESWADALAASARPFRNKTAALAAWWVGQQRGNAGLSSRAAAAYADLGGRLPDLMSLELDAVAADPASFYASVAGRSLRAQAEARLLVVLTAGASAAPEDRAFADAVLFSVSRPALRR